MVSGSHSKRGASQTNTSEARAKKKRSKSTRNAADKPKPLRHTNTAKTKREKQGNHDVPSIDGETAVEHKPESQVSSMDNPNTQQSVKRKTVTRLRNRSIISPAFIKDLLILMIEEGLCTGVNNCPVIEDSAKREMCKLATEFTSALIRKVKVLRLTNQTKANAIVTPQHVQEALDSWTTQTLGLCNWRTLFKEEALYICLKTNIEAVQTSVPSQVGEDANMAVEDNVVGLNLSDNARILCHRMRIISIKQRIHQCKFNTKRSTVLAIKCALFHFLVKLLDMCVAYLHFHDKKTISKLGLLSVLGRAHSIRPTPATPGPVMHAPAEKAATHQIISTGFIKDLLELMIDEGLCKKVSKCPVVEGAAKQEICKRAVDFTSDMIKKIRKLSNAQRPGAKVLITPHHIQAALDIWSKQTNRMCKWETIFKEDALYICLKTNIKAVCSNTDVSNETGTAAEGDIKLNFSDKARHLCRRMRIVTIKAMFHKANFNVKKSTVSVVKCALFHFLVRFLTTCVMHLEIYNKKTISRLSTVSALGRSYYIQQIPSTSKVTNYDNSLTNAVQARTNI
jgi:hypothetical protein